MRARPGDLVGTRRGHAGRCDRIADLFQRRACSFCAAHCYRGDRYVFIGRLLGHDEKFFDLLEASAQQADSSVHHLVDLLGEAATQRVDPRLWPSFAESRREDKRITQELTEQLSKTFITPLEREDIQALAAALYKIPKTVEKIGERILICPQDLHGHSFQKQVELLDQAAETVLAMVKQLRKGTDIPTRPRDERAPADDRRRRG